MHELGWNKSGTAVVLPLAVGRAELDQDHPARLRPLEQLGSPLGSCLIRLCLLRRAAPFLELEH